MEPKLRFKEFSGNWEEKKLGDICSTFKSGKNIKSNQILKTGKYPVYGGNGIRGYTDKYNHEGIFAIIGRQGALCGNMTLIKGKNYLTEHAIAVQGNKYNNTKFLYYMLDNMNLGQYSGQSAQPGLAVNKLIGINTIIPPLPEQTKIADFLSIVDEKIQNQQDKITHLENIKKGFMQKIFSRKIIFKDANGNEFPEWEERKLSRILKEGSKEKVDDTSQYRKITVKLNLKGINFSEIKRDMVDKRPFYIRYKDEIIIGKQNYFNGSIAIVDEIFDGCICSNAIMSFKVIRENLKFVYFYLSQSSYIAKNAYLANGTGQKELTEKDFLNMKIELPCLEEQQKIADFLSSFDEKIEVEKETLEHLKELKKGLLQQMFV